MPEITALLSSPKLLPVPPERLDEFWPLAAPLIERVIDKMGDDTPLDVLRDDIETEDRQLWLVDDGESLKAVVMTMMTVGRDGSTTGYLTHAAGKDFRDWVYITGPIGDFFTSQGCKSFVIIGRKGWSRFLPDFDCSRIYMERKL